METETKTLNKAVKVSIIAGALIIVLSIAYYFVIFLPQNRRITQQQQQQHQQQREASQMEIIKLQKEKEAKVQAEDTKTRNYIDCVTAVDIKWGHYSSSLRGDDLSYYSTGKPSVDNGTLTSQQVHDIWQVDRDNCHNQFGQ